MIEPLPAPMMGLLEESLKITQDRQIRDIVKKINEIIREMNALTAP